MKWQFVWSLLAVVVLLVAADALLQPVPMPVGGAVLLGFIAYSMPRGTLCRCLISAAIGLAIGAAAHATSHILEQRVDSIGGMAMHVAGDAALSALVATVVLTIAIAPGWLIQCHCPRTLNTTSSI